MFDKKKADNIMCLAPTWQQVIDFLRIEHNIFIELLFIDTLGWHISELMIKDKKSKGVFNMYGNDIRLLKTKAILNAINKIK